jgi:hypothetical protein
MLQILFVSQAFFTPTKDIPHSTFAGSHENFVNLPDGRPGKKALALRNMNSNSSSKGQNASQGKGKGEPDNQITVANAFVSPCSHAGPVSPPWMMVVGHGELVIHFVDPGTPLKSRKLTLSNAERPLTKS